MGAGESSDFNLEDLQYTQDIGQKLPGETRIMRNPGSIDKLVTAPHPDHNTVYSAFMHSFAKNGEKPCLGTRSDSGKGPYVWKTYNEVKEISTAFGSGVIDMCPVQNVDGRNFRFIGINAKNREEWNLTDIACVFYNITVVPFYDTLGPDSVTYILNQTEMETAVVSQDKIPTLIALKRTGETANLKNVISMEQFSPEVRQELTDVGFNAFSFDEIIHVGRKRIREYVPARREDIYCFSYTSGTTGNPKGAMLTHGNIMAVVEANNDSLQISENEVHLSYMPMPHVFEKNWYTAVIYYGGWIGLYSGDMMNLMDDLATLKPTWLASVPRLWGRFYDTIQNLFREATGAEKDLIQQAVADKIDHLHKTGSWTHQIWDQVIFHKTKAILGGNVRLCTSGSAPIATEILDFLKICFCVPIVESYGQTESCGPVFVTDARDPMSGHVGGPQRSAEIKLVDIPDMGYSTDDIVNGVLAPRGEVCFRGACIIPGYFKMPDKTAEAIDSDGWLHSGDVGMLLPKGRLKLIDRKKNVFKLAQGEYVTPQKVENLMVQLPVISQIFVHGDSIESYVVAVVVPDEVYLKKWASTNGLSGNYKSLCALEETKAYILNEIIQKGKQERLAGFEIPKVIFVNSEPFTPESDILTPTFKLRRNIAEKAFRSQIDAMYGKFSKL